MWGVRSTMNIKNSTVKEPPKKTPPRLIGRLATTIIMEDGLFLG